MATQQEIASMFNVTQRTVSRVVNGERYVKKELREKILAALKDQGYSTAPAAVNLKRRRKGRIGVALHDAGAEMDMFSSQILIGVNNELSKHHSAMLMFKVGVDDNLETLAMDISQQIDGLVVLKTGHHKNRLDQLGELVWNEIPDKVVIIHASDRESTICPNLTIDNVAGGRLAAQALWNAGCRTPLFVGSRRSVESSRRFQGLLDYYRERGVSVSDESVLCVERPYPRLDESTCQRVESMSIDGIFAWSDSLARLVVFELEKWGKWVPDDLPVVGFNDERSYSVMCPPHLTTVRQPLQEIGRLAVDAAFGDPPPPANRSLTPTLIYRDSCPETEGTTDNTITDH